MSDVTIKKLSGDICGVVPDPVPVCTILTIRNFETLDFELCTPISDFPIPELKDTCNILVKAEGNRLVISLGWVIKEETCNISSEASPSTKTVQEQLTYLINCFQPNSIEDSYEITVDGIVREGSIRKWSFNKSSTTPVTYSARLEFIAGDVVAGES